MVRPRSAPARALPRPLTDTYLRDALVDHLEHSDASFDFMIQFQVNGRTMPIEDASVEWKEQESPYHPVARIRIPGNGSTPRIGSRPANRRPSIPGTAWPSIARSATSTARGGTSTTRWRSFAPTASQRLQVLDDGLTILGRQGRAIEMAAVAVAAQRRCRT